MPYNNLFLEFERLCRWSNVQGAEEWSNTPETSSGHSVPSAANFWISGPGPMKNLHCRQKHRRLANRILRDYDRPLRGRAKNESRPFRSGYASDRGRASHFCRRRFPACDGGIGLCRFSHPPKITKDGLSTRDRRRHPGYRRIWMCRIVLAPREKASAAINASAHTIPVKLGLARCQTTRSDLPGPLCEGT